MKKWKRKVLIFLMTLLFIYSFFYAGKVIEFKNTMKNHKPNAIDTSESIKEEVKLGDDNHCKSYNIKCSYTCSGWVSGFKPTSCYTIPANNGCLGVRSFYVSCSSNGGVSCRLVNTWTDGCKECESGYTLNNGQCILNGCGAGKGKDGNYCSNCASGYYSPNNDDTCHQCGAGTYSTAGSASCTKCPAGKFASGSGNSTCSVCPKGTYSSEGSSECTACTGVYSYQDEEGKSSCKTCTNQIANANHTGCIDVPISGISGGGFKGYLAQGESIAAGVFAYSSYDDNESTMLRNINWSLSNTTGISCSTAGIANYNCQITGVDGRSSCVTKSYGITATSGGSSASTDVSVCIYCGWSSRTGFFRYKNPKPLKRNSRNISGCDFYDGHQEVDGIHTYTSYWNRCCGGGPAPSDVGHCYGNAKYLGIATEVKWMDNAKGDLKYKYDDIQDESVCKLLPEPTTCKKSVLKTTGISEEASTCETEKIIHIDNEGQECNGNQFYEIKCNKTVSTKFDFGGDNSENIISNIDLYAGQGFGFDVVVTTNKSCTGTFNSKAWLASYKKVMDKIATVPEDDLDENIQKRRNELLKLVDDIKEIVTSYNEYIPNEKEAEVLELTLPYKIDKDEKSNTYEFEKQIISKGDGQFIYEEINDNPSASDEYNLKLNVNGLTNPRNFKWNNLSNRRIVKLSPKKVLFERNSGEITENDKEDYVDGGNKIYTNSKTSPGVYTLGISVTGLGGNDSKITNNKCQVTVKENDLIYRPIDVKNPFINNEREKGENWLNTSFDYTSTIDNNTWNKSPLYVFNLKTEDIAELKVSNSSNENAYLGTCYLDEKLQDPIVKNKICDVINNK